MTMKIRMYEEILAMLPSEALRRAIAQRGYTVPELDLLRVVYAYAPNFADQIRCFAAFEQEGATEEVRQCAAQMRAHLEQALAEFERGAPNVVYELRIKETLEAYEEAYLCATAEDARRAISLYYDLYSRVAKECEQTRYRIVKRRIFDGSAPFAEDVLGECEYRAGVVLYRVDACGAVTCEEEDTFCEDCRRPCASRVRLRPMLPKCLADGDVILFSDEEGKQTVGYNLDLDDYRAEELRGDTTLASEYYIIPLYEEGGDYGSWDMFNMHHHVDAGSVERIELSALSERQREAYDKISRFVRENMKRT